MNLAMSSAVTGGVKSFLRFVKVCSYPDKMANPALKFYNSMAFVARNFSSSSIKFSEESEQNISRYPTSNVKELPLFAQQRMYNIDDKSGFIPNIFYALAHRPEQFKYFVKYHDAIRKRENRGLEKEEMEMIGIATSAYNGCIYCVISHSALHRSYSKNPHLADQIAANPDLAPLTERQRAILSLSMTVTKSEPVTEKHFADLAEHGLDKEDAWDITAIAAFISMVNRMVGFLDVQPNQEFYTMGRQTKK